MRKRWKEYLDKLYNDPSEVDEEYMANIDERRNYEDIPDLGGDGGRGCHTKTEA